MSSRSHPALAVVLLLAACAKTESRAPEQAAPPAPAAPPVVTVTANDYAFEMPDTIAAGPTVLRLVNNGTEPHHLQILRLLEGKTMADFAALPPGGPPPAWIVEVGGPNSPRPGGGQSETALNLTMGTYVAVCLIPSPDGAPHTAKGMVKPFMVLPGPEASTAALPTPDVTMNLTDFKFETSAPITAGRRVIRVVNQAEQPHEVFFARLAEGKTVQDLVAWSEKMEGPPPAEPVGGTVGLARFMENYVIADFTPGEYALLCFIPDAKDGKPHIAHGMVQQITVK